MEDTLLRDLAARARDREKTTTDEFVADDPEAESLARRLMEPLAPERARDLLDRVLASDDRREHVAPSPRRRWSSGLMVGFLASAAATLVVVQLRGSNVSHADRPDVIVGESLDFEITVLGGAGSERGDAEATTFLPGDPISVRLRPNLHVTPGTIAVTVRGVQGDKVVELPWSVEPRGDSGVLILTGAADDLTRRGWGRWTLTLRATGPDVDWRGSTDVLIASEAGVR